MHLRHAAMYLLMCHAGVQASLKLKEDKVNTDFPTHLVKYGDCRVDARLTFGEVTDGGWITIHENAIKHAPRNMRCDLNVIDIGAGRGTVVTLLKNKGIKVAGVEEVEARFADMQRAFEPFEDAHSIRG